MESFDIFNGLFQTGTNGKTISMGIGTVEHIEDDSFICVFFLKIALHHRQFIQVSE